MRIIEFSFYEHRLTFILQEEISILTLIEALNEKIQQEYQSKYEQYPIETIDFSDFKKTYSESLNNKEDFDWLLSQLEGYLIDKGIINFILDLEGQVLPK